MKRLLLMIMVIVCVFSNVNIVSAANTKTIAIQEYKEIKTKTIKKGKKYIVYVYFQGKRKAAYKFNKKPKVKILSEKKITYNMLIKRKNKTLYIGYITGKCIDNKGNGKLYIDSPYNYISYKSVKGIKKGNIVRTFTVYNPYNNYEDDIIKRFDKIIK